MFSLDPEILPVKFQDNELMHYIVVLVRVKKRNSKPHLNIRITFNLKFLVYNC